MTAPARSGDPGAERVEVVDADGRVERIVTRAEMRLGNLRHRTTYVVVRNAREEILVHRRAAWKDLWPSRWDIAFGGVCGVGESWIEAATRELAEEAGIAGPLDDLGPVRFESADTCLLGRVFHLCYDGPVTLVDGEVVDWAWVAGRGLSGWAGSHVLCDDTAAVVLPLVEELCSSSD